MSEGAKADYCVICKMIGSNYVRVAGPFQSQEAAVEWAWKMRGGNRAWDFVPQVMESVLSGGDETG
jgi:hypothetical protein